MKLKWRRKIGGGEYTCRSRSPHSKSYMVRRGTDYMWHIFEWNEHDDDWWEIIAQESYLLKTAKERVDRLMARITQ